MAVVAFRSTPIQTAHRAIQAVRELNRVQLQASTPIHRPQPVPRAQLQSRGAGVQLIKCVIHGQVTYTNNPQECPAATESSLTVYPTHGYLSAKP